MIKTWHEIFQNKNSVRGRNTMAETHMDIIFGEDSRANGLSTHRLDTYISYNWEQRVTAVTRGRALIRKVNTWGHQALDEHQGAQVSSQRTVWTTHLTCFGSRCRRENNHLVWHHTVIDWIVNYWKSWSDISIQVVSVSTQGLHVHSFCRCS